MSISAMKSRKKEAEAGLSDDPRQTEITTPNFVLFGETFTFIETFSATVINSDPGNGHIWVKTNTGDEMRSRFLTMVSLSEVHTLSINTNFANIVRMVRMMHIKMRLSLIRKRVNTR